MKYPHKEWLAEAERRYGPDAVSWKFICPVCKHITSGQDWKDAGAPITAVAFSCVGRYLENPQIAFPEKGRATKGPCNYTGGGLFQLNPVTIVMDDGTEHSAFDFAPEESA